MLGSLPDFFAPDYIEERLSRIRESRDGWWDATHENGGAGPLGEEDSPFVLGSGDFNWLLEIGKRFAIGRRTFVEKRYKERQARLHGRGLGEIRPPQPMRRTE